MRSLTPTALQIFSFDSLVPEGHAANLAIEPEAGTVYVALERKGVEGLGIDIAQIASEGSSKSQPHVIAAFQSSAVAPFPLPDYMSETLDLHYFPDDQSLVIILAGGDIATLLLQGRDGLPGPVEVVGSVDSGIKAAAWSPDEEQLILVTGDDNLVCMTRNFDLVHEESLRTAEFGEDAFINVGWGSKSTQFHGSLGKAAARTQETVASTKPASVSHLTDDSLPRVTFRGDAAFFAICSLDPYPFSPSHARRQVRTYSRDAAAGLVPRLSATSESLPGLEGPISWRPSGNLISGLVRYGYEGGGSGPEGKWDVAMLERNGLRHGGFELREKVDVWREGRVRGMTWNADSELLAIWIERKEEDVVQLWSMNNYHYYLKQELLSHLPNTRRFRSIRWHTEQPMTLYLLGEDCLQIRSFVWDTFMTRLPTPLDTASVGVVDGDRLLVTPFRTQNVPPPMSSYTLPLPLTPVHVSFSNEEDAVAAVFPDGTMQVWELNTRLPDSDSGSKLRGGGDVADPKLRSQSSLGKHVGIVPKQIAFGSDEQVAVLCHVSEEMSSDKLFIFRGGVEQRIENVATAVDRLLWAGEAWLLLGDDGVLRSGQPDGRVEIRLCQNPVSVAISHESNTVVALSPVGKLHIASLEDYGSTSTTIASSVTSFTLTPDFLIYGTSSQYSHYAPLIVLQRILAGDEESANNEWETRRIERGALIVTACPSSMSLVLQMPRGNLETVYPRPLVLAVVRRDIEARAYRSAYITCRKHRLDLNILYDLDPAQFVSSLPLFIEQVPEVEYLNLFVSSLNENDSAAIMYQDLRKGGSSKSSSAKVNTVCDALRSLLERRDLVKYVDTVLTTHVCKQPQDYEAALRVLLTLQAAHPDIVEDAVKYIIFLSNVNQLYDVALGMYNFPLVLLVAQYSQKDPKEYLPFLRELKALDKWEQRFRIDDHLARRASALRNLHAAGPTKFDEAISYLARYELYEEAFGIYGGDKANLPVISALYGDYLYDRRDFYESALAYQRASKSDKAMKAYEKAHAWRELFALAVEQTVARPVLLELCERATDYLGTRGRSIEAAQIYIEYAQDVESAVEVLCKGAEFAEARRLTALHSRADLVEAKIHPGLDDVYEAMLEGVEEMRDQLEKEMARIHDLRSIRDVDPNTFYMVEDEPALEGIDVATNATTQASAFTRYTVAPTTVFSQSTKITGQTAKSKHKPSKRRAAGRKGTVDEFEYLLGSIGRLVLRVEEKSSEAVPLLRHLLLASLPHRDLAATLQSTITDLRRQLTEAIEDAWRDRDSILTAVIELGGLGLGGDATSARELVPPSLGEWKGLGLLIAA